MRLVKENCGKCEYLVSLHTPSDTTAGMDGGQKEATFSVILVQYSTPLFSPAPLTLLPCCSQKGPLAKNEGISMPVEFSVINPVCHASVPAYLSLPPSRHPSIHPSILQSTLSHPSLSIPGWRIDCVELVEKEQPLGTYIEAPVCPALCFNEKLKPRQSHTHKALLRTHTHTHTHTAAIAGGQAWVHIYLCCVESRWHLTTCVTTLFAC